MATFTKHQLSRYFSYISFDTSTYGDGPSLAGLEALVKHHLAAVPFESLSLHYSQTRRLSLDPEDLYRKMVGTGRGGYCMELNTFFGTILRTMGYELINTGGRVSHATAGLPGNNFFGWNHMVNLVTIAGQRYLVDVGFGRTNPCRPVPLSSSSEMPGLGLQSIRVYQKTLEQHSDPSQKVWVYSHRENEASDWVDGYAFTEVEFFPADFEVMNLSTMTLPTSFFVQSVLCVKVILGDADEPVGQLILLNNELKRRTDDKLDVLDVFKNEEERIEGFKKWYGISLDELEQKGIVGLSSELKG